MGFFSKISEGLKKTRNSISGALTGFLNSFTKIDEELFEELEEILITCDVGVATSQYICEQLRQKVKENGVKDPSLIRQMLRDVISEILEGDHSLKLDTTPSVILVIGVNGVGKTTTIGKLANNLKSSGKSVILGAADTFRAAAMDQLQVWADRVGTDIIKSNEGADPASVIFDTVTAAKARKKDVVICDTAGRLHNKKNLMDELGKINRVIRRELPDARVETLLVLDATTGQNAVNQTKEFMNVCDITGIVLTKLDGTARGGIVIAINHELGIPVKYIGVGEGIDDLQPFVAHEFTDSLFENTNDRGND